MCSSRLGNLRRPWSLRARLLAGQIALLTVACLGIGAVTELALYQYLVGQVDRQLYDAAHRSVRLHGQPRRRWGTGGTGLGRARDRISSTLPGSRPAWSVW